uniref:Transmembrane protein 230 n=1 Tax=Steinernema glaseri TaxID=37863 RepID=A0A1I7YRB7_9BILA
MTSFYSGHHRNSSAAQQLITTKRNDVDDEEQVEIYTSPVVDARRVGTMQSQGAASECSSYYMPPNYVPPVKKRSPLRANIRVVIGSILLTLIGIGLLAFGIFIMVIPHNISMFAGVNGWIFLIVGLLFFIPGFYHVVYISCTLCGRPGYSFDSLPTFNK